MLFTAVMKFYKQGDIFDDIHEYVNFINLSSILVTITEFIFSLQTYFCGTVA